MMEKLFLAGKRNVYSVRLSNKIHDVISWNKDNDVFGK